MVAVILGARTLKTPAISRGQNLEAEVRKAVGKELGLHIQTCGLYISREHPMIAISPDGIVNKITFEIKCPTTDKTAQTYIDKAGRITKKYYAQVQIQIQMYCACADESYFCVADSDFEINNQVNIIKVVYDHQYVLCLLDSVVAFWKENIFPLLHKNVMYDVDNVI